MRKIKDAIDLTTGERVYFRGHAKSTYLSDGRTVEDADSEIRAEITELSNELSNKAEKTDIVSPDWRIASPDDAGYIKGRTHFIDDSTFLECSLDANDYEVVYSEFNEEVVDHIVYKNSLSPWDDFAIVAYYDSQIGIESISLSSETKTATYLRDKYQVINPESEWGTEVIAKLEYIYDDYGDIQEKKLCLQLANNDAYSAGEILGNFKKIKLGYAYGLWIKQLDEKFVPHTIARTEQVDELREETTALWENLDHGVFPDLVAGDLAGRGESVPAEFGFRASGGKSIKDGRAYIKRIKGNSVVWNQHIKGIIKSESGLSISISDDDIISINGTATSILANFFATDYGVGADALKNAPLGRYVLDVKIINNPDNLSVNIFAFNGRISFPNVGNYTTSYQKIGDCRSLSAGGGFGISSYGGTGTVFNNVRFKVSLYNLTQMFGAGNEPTTIEDFNARVATLGVDMNAYNEGQVIHCNTESIKSVGDNAWDEQWENGSFDTTNGSNNATISQIRSVNLIPILPSMTYAVSQSIGEEGLWIMFYDKGGNVVEKPSHSISLNNAIKANFGATFNTPSNAAWMKFYTTTNYGATYNHDIMITLVHSGWKQDTDAGYQPYWQDTLPLPIIRKYFPDGMKKAGSAHDEIRYNKVTQKWEYSKGKIKSVDLGTLNWRAQSIKNVNYFASYNNTLNAVIADDRINNERYILCAKYQALNRSEGNTQHGSPEDKVILLNHGYFGNVNDTKDLITIRDSSYTDAATFKAAMEGVMLYYESNDWEWVELDAEDQNFRDYYKVADFGTEQSQSSVPSANFSADIIYQFNAVDMIREHELEITELQKVIATMQAQLASLTNDINDITI